MGALRNYKPHESFGGTSVVRDGDRMLVALWGEHDLSTVGVIDATLTEALTTGLDVVVDLRDVEFMDATTVRSLVNGSARVAEHGRRLSLQAVHGLPFRLLEICGLSGMIESNLPMFDGRPAATTALETWVEVPPIERPTDRASTFANVNKLDDCERRRR